ncbi:MAG: polysulfide reductase NrfD [Desulfovibrionaceae bacterium]|nr:polysulfide reductase NrfD [Desulfovibrionaceae bacterium]
MSDQPQQTGKPGLITPFNVFAALVLVIGAYLTFVRFTQGLGGLTNLNDNNPWGLWIGFDLLCGVALAAGGYTTSTACYVFGLKRFHAAVRPAILTAFLGYAFVVFALHYDVGRPWRLPYPIFVSPGTTSLLFEVGLCVFLYLTVLFVEWVPAALEWLGVKKPRDIIVNRLTLVLTIFGVVLSTMHQSSLGALYTIAPSKLHPLWYSQYLPLYFFISSMFAGLSMVILEGTLSHRYFHHLMDEEHKAGYNDLILGFAKGASIIMAGYFIMKLMGISADNNWAYLGTGYGLWFLVELFGFVALPSFLYAIGVREKNYKLIQWTSALSVFGIVLNRFNVSLVAFNWQLPAADRYFPSWGEFGISIFIVTLLILVFRFIVTRMPIFYEHPQFKDSHH